MGVRSVQSHLTLMGQARTLDERGLDKWTRELWCSQSHQQEFEAGVGETENRCLV